MKELAKKLLAIQTDMQAIKKDSVNPHFKNSYFDINTLIAELKPVLNKHGVTVNQMLTNKDGRNTLTTVVTDAVTAESTSSDVFLPDTGKPQELGSAITYFRRYALQSLFLLEAEDDDGNTTASEPGKTIVNIKRCVMCKKEFTPDPKYPYSTTCSAACSKLKKELAEKTS